MCARGARFHLERANGKLASRNIQMKITAKRFVLSIDAISGVLINSHAIKRGFYETTVPPHRNRSFSRTYFLSTRVTIRLILIYVTSTAVVERDVARCLDSISISQTEVSESAIHYSSRQRNSRCFGISGVHGERGMCKEV